MNELDLLKQRIAYLETQLQQLIKTDRYTFNKDIQMSDGRNIIAARSTGTMIATEASQKIGFFGKTPKVQVPTASVPSTAAGIIITLKDFGFYES